MRFQRFISQQRQKKLGDFFPSVFFVFAGTKTLTDKKTPYSPQINSAQLICEQSTPYFRNKDQYGVFMSFYIFVIKGNIYKVSE